MATRKQSTESTDNLVEASSVDNIIDGIEDTSEVSGNSEISTGRTNTIGFLETEGKLIPLVEGTDLTPYIFVGTAGSDKVYRK